MQGRLLMTGGSGRYEFDLPRGLACVTCPDEGVPSLAVGAPEETAGLWLEWLPRMRTWGYRVISADAGGAEARTKAFGEKDRITWETWNVEFRRMLSTPLIGGAEFLTCPLDPAKVYDFGRGGEIPEGCDSHIRVALDMEEASISKVHARATYVAGEWKIEDLSKTGTELNGAAFVEQRLIFGDRFRIRDYVFEFRGNEIRRVDQLGEGAIQAKDLVVVVPDRVTGKPLKILDQVSLRIGAGEFIGILGGSGQGKSTLLNALCGIRPADEGKVLVGGVPNLVLNKIRPGSIGYVPQDDIVHRELVVRDALLLNARLRLKLPKAGREALVDRTIELLGLTEHASKRVAHLSGGQRKRVSIGIELLSKPSVLFLDEPSSGLDPATEESLMELLQSLTLTNLTVVCTTHVLQKAYLFDRLLFVHGGRLIFDGNADEAREHFLGASVSKDGGSITASGDLRSPLEKIYSAVLRGTVPAAQWEERFKQWRGGAGGWQDWPEETSAASQAGKSPRVSARVRFVTLLTRQWKILIADWLNLAFLFSQVLLIGFLISWVSDDFGFRLFLGLIATMWFGCSNGAQQIVGELAILQREQVCGLGRNVYLASKFAFQGFVSCVQGLTLFTILIVLGHLFHPADFNRENFLSMLVERETPLMANGLPVAQAGTSDDFDPIGNSGDGAPAASVPAPPPPSAPAKAPEKPKAVVMFPRVIAKIAHMFVLNDNILDSGPRELKTEQGESLMGPDGVVLKAPGIGLWRVIFLAIGMKILAFAGAAFVGVGMGLAVSAWVRTPTQAVMWVPLLLIPQILFGGYVITLPKMPASVRKVAVAFPSHACQRILDVSNLYGRATPFVTNQTKNPVFLNGSAEKETIEWRDGTLHRTQDFERESEVNTSWQNLVVHCDRVGHHKVVEEFQANDASGSPFFRKRDTVETRDDVKYRKGIVFQFLYPAMVAGWILMGWMAFCYTSALAGVHRKT
jgi:ABC-type multidrug transport system ATPase subunit